MSIIAKFIAIGACVVSLCVTQAGYLYDPAKIDIPSKYCKNAVPEVCLIDELINRLERNKIDTIDNLFNLTSTIDNGLLFMSKEQATQLSNLNGSVSKKISVPVYVTGFVKTLVENRKRDEVAPPEVSAAYVAMLTTSNKAKLASVGDSSVDEVVNLTRIANHVKMNVLDREYPQRRIASLYLHRGELDKATQYILKTKDMTFPDEQNRSSRYPGVGDPAIGLIHKLHENGNWIKAYNLAEALKDGKVYCAENHNCGLDFLWSKAASIETPEVRKIFKSYCEEKSQILLHPDNQSFALPSTSPFANPEALLNGQVNPNYRRALWHLFNANCLSTYPDILNKIKTTTPFLGGEYLLKIVRVLKGEGEKVLEEVALQQNSFPLETPWEELDAAFVRKECELQKNLPCLKKLEEILTAQKVKYPNAEKTPSPSRREKTCFQTTFGTPIPLKEVTTDCLLEMLYARAFYAYVSPRAG